MFKKQVTPSFFFFIFYYTLKLMFYKIDFDWNQSRILVIVQFSDLWIVLDFAPQLDWLSVDEIKKEHELVVVAVVRTRRPIPPNVNLNKSRIKVSWVTRVARKKCEPCLF